MIIKIVETYIDNQLKDTILKDTILSVSKERAEELISKGVAVIPKIEKNPNIKEIKTKAVKKNKKEVIEDEQ